MKGIILAGGTGSRLYPLTPHVGKQLLPVYDKPMIYYPLSTLISFGIDEILIISDPLNLPILRTLLGDGSRLGISLSYLPQEQPNGIGEALLIGAPFIGNDAVCLMLGDNFFYGDMPMSAIMASNKQASVLGILSDCPQQYGVAVLEQGMLLAIEEKPRAPKSNVVIPGIYFYQPGVAEYAKQLAPSSRGELEITDLNNLYAKRGELDCHMLTDCVWFDLGKPDDLFAAAAFVKETQASGAGYIGCIEETAYRQGRITKEQVSAIADVHGNSAYGQYLKELAGI